MAQGQQAPAPVGILGDHAEDLLLAQFLQSEDAALDPEASAPIPPAPPRPMSHRSESPLIEDDFAFAMRLQEDERRLETHRIGAVGSDADLGDDVGAVRRAGYAAEKDGMGSAELDDLLFALQLQAEEEDAVAAASGQSLRSRADERPSFSPGVARRRPEDSGFSERLQAEDLAEAEHRRRHVANNAFIDVPSRNDQPADASNLAKRGASPAVESGSPSDPWGRQADDLLLALQLQAEESGDQPIPMLPPAPSEFNGRSAAAPDGARVVPQSLPPMGRGAAPAATGRWRGEMESVDDLLLALESPGPGH